MDFIAQRARAGQSELAQTVRMLVQRRAPLCFDCLNQRADKVFLQPTVFAWLTSQRTDINPYQVFYAALALTSGRAVYRWQPMAVGAPTCQAMAMLPG